MPEQGRVATLVLAVALLAGCGGQDVAPGPAPAPTAEASASGSPAPRGASAPVRVTVPRLGIDEQLIDLGIDDASGELEVPEDPDDVGWFTGGGKPGEDYPVVVAGHKDSTTGPAVFARLTELQADDEFSILDAAGQRFTYRVVEVRDVPQDDSFPTEEVYGRADSPQARLITCTGPYDRGVGRYTENRVVFAEQL